MSLVSLWWNGSWGCLTCLSNDTWLCSFHLVAHSFMVSHPFPELFNTAMLIIWKGRSTEITLNLWNIVPPHMVFKCPGISKYLVAAFMEFAAISVLTPWSAYSTLQLQEKKKYFLLQEITKLLKHLTCLIWSGYFGELLIFKRGITLLQSWIIINKVH